MPPMLITWTIMVLPFRAAELAFPVVARPAELQLIAAAAGTPLCGAKPYASVSLDDQGAPFQHMKAGPPSKQAFLPCPSPRVLFGWPQLFMGLWPPVLPANRTRACSSPSTATPSRSCHH